MENTKQVPEMYSEEQMRKLTQEAYYAGATDDSIKDDPFIHVYMGEAFTNWYEENMKNPDEVYSEFEGFDFDEI